MHVEAGALQQQRGDGGVDAAGHADDDSFRSSLTRRELYRRQRAAESRDGGYRLTTESHLQRRFEAQAGDRVERLALAEQEVVEAAQDQRRAQARGLRQQLLVRQPQRAHDARVERLLRRGDRRPSPQKAKRRKLRPSTGLRHR